MISKRFITKIFSQSRIKFFFIFVTILCFLFNLSGCYQLYANAIDKAKFIETAIKHEYKSVYKGLEDLRLDYPGFMPEVQSWSDGIIGVSDGLYSISLPEKLIIMDIKGNVVTSRACGSSEGESCRVIPPRKPILGIVGTLQYDNAPKFEAVRDYKASWSDKDRGTVLTSSNCFSAFSDNAIGLELTIAPQTRNAVPIDFRNTYGYYFVRACFQSPDLKREPQYFSTFQNQRISKSLFLQLASCSQDVSNPSPELELTLGIINKHNC
jgi:hypothetical protein